MGTVERATIHFDPGFADERPRVNVELGAQYTQLFSLRDAIDWASERADRVGVRYDAAGDMDPADPRVADLVRRWDLDQERFTAEWETCWDEPREWYLALENPDVEGDTDAAARLVEENPHVRRVLSRATTDGRSLWFVEVMARSAEEARETAHNAVLAVLWTPARMERTFPTESSFVIGVSRNETVGLVEYRDAHFFSAW